MWACRSRVSNSYWDGCLDLMYKCYNEISQWCCALSLWMKPPSWMFHESSVVIFLQVTSTNFPPYDIKSCACPTRRSIAQCDESGHLFGGNLFRREAICFQTFVSSQKPTPSCSWIFLCALCLGDNSLQSICYSWDVSSQFLYNDLDYDLVTNSLVTPCGCASRGTKFSEFECESTSSRSSFPLTWFLWRCSFVRRGGWKPMRGCSYSTEVRWTVILFEYTRI